MHSISLYPLITRPARITMHSATVIDNICTSLIKDDLVVGIIIDDISNHLPIFWSFLANKHEKQTFIYKRKINNLDLLCQSLRSTSWECVLNCKDVDVAHELFLNIFKEKLDEAIH